jgi:hypothetical protein
MKLLIIMLLLLIVIVLISKKKQKKQEELGVSIPRTLPVYIDSPLPYLNEPILYSEWPQEISSSL